MFEFTHEEFHGRHVCRYFRGGKLIGSGEGRSFVEAHTAMMRNVADLAFGRKVIDGN